MSQSVFLPSLKLLSLLGRLMNWRNGSSRYINHLCQPPAFCSLSDRESQFYPRCHRKTGKEIGMIYNSVRAPCKNTWSTSIRNGVEAGGLQPSRHMISFNGRHVANRFLDHVSSLAPGESPPIRVPNLTARALIRRNPGG